MESPEPETTHMQAPPAEAESTSRSLTLEKFQAVDRSVKFVENPFELLVQDRNSEDLLKLATFELPAVGQTRAILFFIPSYGQYVQRDAFFFKPIAEAGIHVYGLDRRGFGKSEGKPGEVGDFIFQDNHAFIEAALAHGKHDSALPKFLFGMSMGALIAASSLIQDPGYFKGAILDVPWFGSNYDEDSFAQLKNLYDQDPDILLPALETPDPDMLQFYTNVLEKDPLVYKQMTVGTFEFIMNEQARALANAPKVVDPVLIITGAKDDQVDNEKTKEFYDSLSSKDKQLIEIPDANHLHMFLDGDYKVVLQLTLDFINRLV